MRGKIFWPSITSWKVATDDGCRSTARSVVLTCSATASLATSSRAAAGERAFADGGDDGPCLTLSSNQPATTIPVAATAPISLRMKRHIDVPFQMGGPPAGGPPVWTLTGRLQSNERAALQAGKAIQDMLELVRCYRREPLIEYAIVVVRSLVEHAGAAARRSIEAGRGDRRGAGLRVAGPVDGVVHLDQESRPVLLDETLILKRLAAPGAPASLVFGQHADHPLPFRRSSA